MTDRNRKNMRRILSLILCVTIGMNGMHVYATGEAETEGKEDPIIVVSLGDSYSSGEGIEPFYGQDEDTAAKVKNPDWLAHRSTLSWPSLLSVDGLDGTLGDHKDENWFFVASSGAVTDNLFKTQQKAYDIDGISGTKDLDPQLDVFDQFEKDTVDYVTLTFGGNNVGFSNIITTGVTDGAKTTATNFANIVKQMIFSTASVSYVNPRELTEKMNKTWDEFYAEGGTEDQIREAYEDIADRAGSNAAIIVAGYPKLLAQNSLALLFMRSEAAEINSNVSKFNQALQTIVDSCAESGMNIYFVPVEEAFDGHEAYSSESYINGIILKGIPGMSQDTEDLKDGVGPSDYSIHPNADGAIAYAYCVQAKIEEIETGVRAESGSMSLWAKIKAALELKDFVEDMVRDAIDRQLELAAAYFLEQLEEYLNEWLASSCDGCY